LFKARTARRSTDQAKNRDTGPASRRENSIPSGVLMVSVFVFIMLIIQPLIRKMTIKHG
jgi:hypothetical protein